MYWLLFRFLPILAQFLPSVSPFSAALCRSSESNSFGLPIIPSLRISSRVSCSSILGGMHRQTQCHFCLWWLRAHVLVTPRLSCHGITALGQHLLFGFMSLLGPLQKKSGVSNTYCVERMSLVKRWRERITGDPASVAVAGGLRQIVASRNPIIPWWTVGCSSADCSSCRNMSNTKESS